MEKLFYTAKDISELLGYSTNKAYNIIKQLNCQQKEEAKSENKDIMTFNGRISKEYFHKKTGININKELKEVK